MIKTVRLRRLCELRRIEELNQAAQLELARTQLEKVDRALESVRLQKRSGRVLVQEGICTGETRDRIAGFQEIAHANRVSKFLLKHKHLAEERIVWVRGQFAAKRAERCQAETLLESELDRERKEAQRRSQASLDELHRSLRLGLETDAAEDGCSFGPANT